MEYNYKMMRKFVFAFLTLLLFNSCGYFENDGLKNQKSIVGNINIAQYNGSDKIDLVFYEANDICAFVVGDCRLVYYDSIKNIIYVESPITKSTSSYYRIVVKDPLGEEVLKALRKEVIDKNTFKKGVIKRGSVQIELE